MEFKRYDGFLSRYNIIQKKFDKELLVCPFCGEFPHWYLNVQNGFNLISATCICEKCKAKLNTEYKVLNIKTLKAVDLGEKNVHNLELNTTYSLEVLQGLTKIKTEGVILNGCFNKITQADNDDIKIDSCASQKTQAYIGFVDNNFTISKEIPILASGWASTKLLIDNHSKKFIYKKGKSFSKTYKFSDLINYEVYENGKSKVQGRAGSALIGGAFFGLGGLIVGSSMSRNINEKCNQLKLIIRLNDFNYPQIVITYVDNVDWDKSGWVYRNMKENIQAVCSMLEYMLNEKTLEQSSSVKQEEKPIEQKSAKEQLQELKEMLDDGLITQEDFEQKKKQILGL